MADVVVNTLPELAHMLEMIGAEHPSVQSTTSGDVITMDGIKNKQVPIFTYMFTDTVFGGSLFFTTILTVLCNHQADKSDIVYAIGSSSLILAELINKLYAYGMIEDELMEGIVFTRVESDDNLVGYQVELLFNVNITPTC